MVSLEERLTPPHSRYRLDYQIRSRESCFCVGNRTSAGAFWWQGGGIGDGAAPWTMATARELRALCDQFKDLMRRDVERTAFDKEACQRIGEMIGRSAHQGQSEYPYSSRRR